MALDPVTCEILWSAFTAIAGEMGVVEYRSSFSPAIREQLDFSCAVCDPQGRMLADAGYIPAQEGTVESALRATLAVHGPLEPGDVVVGNDPYHGATHLPDVEIFMPAYSQSTLLGYTASVAHHVDVGGLSPRNRGTTPGAVEGANDLFEEGLILPNVKLIDRGTENKAVWDIFLANVRDPTAVDGDLRAQIAACRRGADRLSELAQRYSAQAVTQAMDLLIEDTSARTRAELDAWPTAKATRRGYLDGDGLNFSTPVPIAVSVAARNGFLDVDLTGSSPQVPGPVNIPWASTHAAIYYVARCFLGVGLRQNHGFTRHIRVRAPEGSIVNPRHPAAVVLRHMAVQRLADTLFQALGDLLPDRAMASSHVSFPAMQLRAVDPRTGRETTILDLVGGGGGARRDCPGDNSIDSYVSNCAHLPAEIIELDYPIRVERTELVDGSGGSGRQQGGLGMRREYVVLADRADGCFSAEQMIPEFGASGREGGDAGAPARVFIRRAGTGEWVPLSHNQSRLDLTRGDALALVTAGGGGFGAIDGSPVEVPQQ